MKEVIEKLGLTEFLAYLCPGIIVLMSTFLWVRPDLIGIVGQEIARNQIIMGVSFLLLSYSAGLIIASWAAAGAHLFIRTRMGTPEGTHKILITLIPLWWFHWLAVPRQTRNIVEGRLRIAEGLDSYGGLPGLSILLSPWDNLTTYRIIMFNRMPDKAEPLFKEADAVRGRRLFALGVGLASMLLSSEALLRLLMAIVARLRPASLFSRLLENHLPPASAAVLLSIAVIGIAASFGLRQVAGRSWEYELLLTCSVARLAEQFPPNREK